MEQSTHSPRRKFLRNLSLGTLGLAALPDISFAAAHSEKAKKITLKKDAVILFQGDSITDAGRKRDHDDANNGAALGTGYAFLAAAALLKKFPDRNLKIYNRGISGNKVYQLAERWDADCLNLQPDVLSILIGVNDYWHTLTGAYTGTIKTYKDDFTALLDRTKQKLPGVQLIIGEPFAVNHVKAVDDKWFPAFNDYRVAAKEIAMKYDAVFIPYQDIIDKAQQSAPGSYWTGDGVHPSLAGAELMASSWLEAVK
ncbi:SGNH/GDSL hydrolase family protein [Chitinophaga sancti]|uniref:Lysophospholipase L1 n=1 Tax=Chitinophaga sancti TaxID=1004 RepID=A0A1K1NDU0_9BACT|nr:SGNH/GDSL hydrolase family protein [Chitinophaga sancti]WQD63300.1 SGNH/GDSL hydrolase family protein [Chitinophaga sancti]WQG91074.1 SGNH/GDSL hydrolase family protein [Chitinophaga sancti]SFW33417.1 Lysophospholipase L1 [Chitinophaga sancti]